MHCNFKSHNNYWGRRYCFRDGKIWFRQKNDTHINWRKCFFIIFVWRKIARARGVKKMNQKILVGCPTADFKEYCLDAYIDGIKNLKFANFDLIVVDNSKTNKYFETLKKKITKEIIPNANKIEIIKDEFKEHARDRIVSSRNIIRQKVLDGKYDYFLSLEQDIVPSKDIIEKLLSPNKKIITAVYFN